MLSAPARRSLCLTGYIRLRGDVRHPWGRHASAIRPTAQVRCSWSEQVRAQSDVYGWFHRALWLRPVRTVAGDSALYSAVASIRSSLCDPVRRAASPRHVWSAIRGLLPFGAPLVASPLPRGVTHALLLSMWCAGSGLARRLLLFSFRGSLTRIVELASGFACSRTCEERCCKDRPENGAIPAVPGIALDENHLKGPGIDEAHG